MIIEKYECCTRDRIKHLLLFIKTKAFFSSKDISDFFKVFWGRHFIECIKNMKYIGSFKFTVNSANYNRNLQWLNFYHVDLRQNTISAESKNYN